MMNRIYSFAPIVNARTKILVVGSMPSVRSLEKGQYYANPQNLFWPMVFEVLGGEFTNDYQGRCAFLLDHHIGLWDAAGSCVREGSLDSNMRQIIPNDFAALFERYPGIMRVLCNGGTAMRLYQKAAGEREGISVFRLPSTSPAAAMWKREEKIRAWRPYLLGNAPKGEE